MMENVYKEMLKALTSGKEGVIVTSYDLHSQERTPLRKEFITKDMLASSNSLEENLRKKSLEVLEKGKLEFISTNQQDALLEPYYPEPRLIVLGGGHVSKPLIDLALTIGFNTTVVDDRPSFANRQRFPKVNVVLCEDFEKVFGILKPTNYDYVVIVTRGHRHDQVCLRQALNYNPYYLGMIGSKRRVGGIKDQLLSEGFSAEQINRVNAPIGLDLGAVTPEEIAISIIAQIISYRRSKTINKDGTIINRVTQPEFDRVVLEELAKDTQEPKAIATILSSKGSVPRKAGAKMIVWPDGRILGSIGGGCSEGHVITAARQIIDQGGFQTLDLDMTGEVAEDEGMVCGGIMQVFIERANP